MSGPDCRTLQGIEERASTAWVEETPLEPKSNPTRAVRLDRDGVVVDGGNYGALVVGRVHSQQPKDERRNRL